MRKIILGILLALPAVTIFVTRPSSILHSASASPGERPKTDKEKANPKPGAKDQTTPGEEGYQIKVNVSLVTTDISIVGQAPLDLKAEDFIIYDDGVAQPATFFSQDQLPLAIAILIDASESIRPFTPVLQLAAVSALRRLRPDDKVVLYQFNRYPQRLTDLTDDRLLVLDRVNKVQISTCTNINDTLSDSAAYLAKMAPTYRRAAILISDNEGIDANSAAGRMLNCVVIHDTLQARNELLESGVTLFDIRASVDDFPNQARAENWNFYDNEIFASVEQTGGEKFRVNETNLLQHALGDSINKLRKQITLGFNPSNPGKPGVFHKLTVKFANANRCPGCRIRSRTGYYSGVTASYITQPAMNKLPSSYTEQADDQLIKIMINAILAQGFNSTEIPFNVEPTQQTDARGNPEVKLDFKIQLNQIEAPVKNGKHLCKIRVVVSYENDRGDNAGSREAKISGGLNDDQYKKFMQEGIPLSMNIPLVGKKQTMKIIVYDENSDKAGGKTIHYTSKK
jgi:VWFA-related protein